MTPGTMTRGREPHAPTVYTVLAASARSHSRRYLAGEALLAGMAAALVLAWQPRWWPAACLALTVGLYAGWGLLARGPLGHGRARWSRLPSVVVAGLATAAALAGLGGLAVRAFWGTAPGPYGMCHQPDGTSYACDAEGNRRPVSRPPD